MKAQFYLRIKNNTVGTVPITILQAGSPQNIANARTQYRWNITGLIITPLQYSLSLQFTIIAPMVTYTGTLAVSSVDAVVAALNGLNVGAFWSETIGPNTYIVTWNDQIIYSSLIIGSPTPASSSVVWANDTLVAGGSMQIDVNAVNQVNSNNPGPASSTITPLVGGDAVDVAVQASIGEPTLFQIIQILATAPFTQTVLKDVTVPSAGSDGHSFVVDLDYTYSVQWGSPP